MTVMGFINFIVFSVLIILNIANINTDPPYWVAGSTGIVAIGIYFSCKMRGYNYWKLFTAFFLFLLLYLSRIHTVPYFGLPLDSVLGDTFLADGSWGRLWIFYGGSFLVIAALWYFEKFIETPKLMAKKEGAQA